MKKRLKRIALPGKTAMGLLRIGLPMISAVLTALALHFHAEAETAPLTALITYPDMFSHVLASLFLLILGAMIFDMAERK
ncbi:MAG: hypothetical protein IJZ89_09365 [Clostridia bacterium]|nr:hypothetical protein [Clostridia bacterium]